ncbi:reverse transcriptase domain-containing protein [Tanacetum coccineum]|uniref:Reverse transcriptase domain-containing protein n=1 Tax=Tanacetum coccineum TaxID=301880 RepID=A0ABQ5H8R0_9ASTR
MRTRSSSNLIVESSTIPKRRNCRRSKQIVEPEIRTIVETPVTTNLKNDITNFQQKFEETFGEACDRFKELLRKCPHHGFLELHQIDTFYNALTPRDALTIIENKSKLCTSRNKPIVSKVSTTTSSQSPSPDITALTDMCLGTDSNTFNAYAATGTYNQGGPGYRPQGGPNYRASNQIGPPSFPPSNELTNYMKSNEATLRAMQTQMTNMNTELRNEFQSTIDTRTNKIENQNNQIMNMLTNMKKQNPSSSGSLTSNTVVNPRGDLKAITTRSGVSYDGPTIPPTSPLQKDVERETEATKDKLDECLALADLGASFNLMPLSVWKKISLSKLTPTRMILELADRSVAHPKGVAEDVFVKVGKFYFLADFVVVDYDVDPRVPLILGRYFLRMSRALIDVHGEELTLRVNDEAITFKVGHTSR